MGWLNRFRSRPLLSYDEVQSELRSHRYTFCGLHTIDLESVVGSQGRWRDFSRDFQALPQHQQRIQSLAEAGAEVQGRPIEVYRLDQVYFIRDGHHRVALARSRGQAHIQALVTEVEVRAPLTAEMEQEQVLQAAQLSHFLQETNLDQHAPNSDFSVSRPGLHEVLMQHIEVHRYYLGCRYHRPFSLIESAASWHDLVYQPVQEALQLSGARREFPQRTAVELYLWVAYHREHMRELGQELQDLEVARGLVEQFSERPGFSLWKRFRRVFLAAWKAAQEGPEPPRLAGGAS